MLCTDCYSSLMDRSLSPGELPVCPLRASAGLRSKHTIPPGPVESVTQVLCPCQGSEKSTDRKLTWRRKQNSFMSPMDGTVITRQTKYQLEDRHHQYCRSCLYSLLTPFLFYSYSVNDDRIVSDAFRRQSRAHAWFAPWHTHVLVTGQVCWHT